MGCFEDCRSEIMEPYGGNMPLFRSADTTDATVTIVQESYDDGMSVTRIQTPPRTQTKTLIDVIDNILGFMGDLDIGTKSSNKKEDGEKDDSQLQNKRKDRDKDKEKHGGFGSSVSDSRISEKD